MLSRFHYEQLSSFQVLSIKIFFKLILVKIHSFKRFFFLNLLTELPILTQSSLAASAFPPSKKWTGLMQGISLRWRGLRQLVSSDVTWFATELKKKGVSTVTQRVFTSMLWVSVKACMTFAQLSPASSDLSFSVQVAHKTGYNGLAPRALSLATVLASFQLLHTGSPSLSLSLSLSLFLPSIHGQFSCPTLTNPGGCGYSYRLLQRTSRTSP